MGMFCSVLWWISSCQYTFATVRHVVMYVVFRIVLFCANLYLFVSGVVYSGRLPLSCFQWRGPLLSCL